MEYVGNKHAQEYVQLVPKTPNVRKQICRKLLKYIKGVHVQVQITNSRNAFFTSPLQRLIFSIILQPTAIMYLKKIVNKNRFPRPNSFQRFQRNFELVPQQCYIGATRHYMVEFSQSIK
ncbi:Hypothetical_protein [Hexamita inflata]|uniref:Hypothetical_protein n=1 Tax=Hexamita inflata TaxID=28002 RepID=A0ABP1HLL8_9EUKA